MNKIYKVIWSHCTNAFIVVSELARSRSTGSTTSRSARRIARSSISSPLTALATGMALAFGLSAPALAVSAAEPGGNVEEISAGDPNWVAGTDVENTAYGNALKINANAGPIYISGGAFSVNPTALNEDRGTDANPYAAIWVSESDHADSNRIYLGELTSVDAGDPVTIKVNGENLHGIYTEKSTFARSIYSIISATGKEVSGITTKGRIQLTGGEITVDGAGAKGVHVADGGDLAVDGGAKIIATGNGAIGIHVENASLRVNEQNFPGPVLDININGSNAKGIALTNSSSQLLDNIAITMSGNNSYGMHLETGSGATLTNSTITTTGQNQTGIYAVNDGTKATIEQTNIDISGGSEGKGVHASDLGELHLLEGSVTVTSQNGHGLSAEEGGFISAEKTEITVGSLNAGTVIGAHTNENARFELTETHVNVSGQGATGLSLTNNSRVDDTDSEIKATGTFTAIGVGAWSDSYVNLTGTKLDVEANNASGIIAQGSTITLSAVDAHVVGGDGHTFGINSRNSNVEVQGTKVVAQGTNSVSAWDSEYDDLAQLDGVTLDATTTSSNGGAYAYAARVLGTENISITGNSLLKANAQVSGAVGLSMERGATATVDHAKIVATSISDGAAFGITLQEDSKATISSTEIDLYGEKQAHGVNVFDDSELTSSNSNITAIASNAGGNAKGIYADQSKVTLSNTNITVEGAIASGILASDSELTISGGEIKVTGLGGSGALGGKTSDSIVKLDGVTVSVDGLRGTGWSSEYDSQFTLSNSTINYKGEAFGNALELFGVQDAQILNSTILSSAGSGTDEGKTALFAADGGYVHIAGSQLYAASTNTDSDTWVSGLDIAYETNVTVSASSIEASGANDDTYAVLMFDGGATLTTSDQTRLVSSHGAVYLESDGVDLQVNMTDTELVAGGNTFSLDVEGDATQNINLGSGVVATENNNTLLAVRRMPYPGSDAGRVLLNISGDAQLAGAILEDENITSLADLVDDGGIYLNLTDGANYSGLVSNVREVNLQNAARIGGGTVAAPNTVLENIHVNSDATFAGNWNVAGTLHAANGGRIAPGNSIGVITTNAINWGAGSILEIEVNAAGDSDRVEVTGPTAANISNTALHVMQEDGTGGYRLDHDYTIMTAAGGIDGKFTEASWQGSELIRVNTRYSADDVNISLSVNEQALDTANFTANQHAVSKGALSVAGLNTAADAAFLSDNPAASFDSLSGEIHPSTRAGLMHSNALVSNAILGRLRDRAAPVTGEDSLSAKSPVWVSYTHHEQTSKGDSKNTDRRKHKIDSIAIGGDVVLDSGWNIGGAFAYANNDIKLKARQSSSDTDSYSVAAYAGKSWEKGENSLNIMAGLGHTWHDISTKRNVDLGGAQNLKAKYDARTLQLFGELGYSMPVGERTTVEPYLGLTWLQHRTDGFTEKGGDAALKGRSGTDDVSFSTLGVRTSTLIDAGEQAIKLNAGLGWRHAFGDRQPNTKLSFVQGSGSAFSVVGAPIARNSAVFDVGAEVQVGRNASIGLSYEAQAGNSFTQHAGNVYLKARF